MKRNENALFGCISIVLIISAVFACQLLAAPTNFLLITVDDMDCKSVGAWGCPVDDITPNIDKLASEGRRFLHGYVAVAICQPCRQSLMTGRYAHSNGAPGFNPVPDSVPVLQEKLHNAGYLLGILGKAIHLAPERRFMWDFIKDQDSLGCTMGRDPNRYYTYTKRFLADAKAKNKPFFLMANSHDPHRPYAGSTGDFPNCPVRRTYKESEIRIPGFLPDLPNIRKEMAQYFTSVHRADETTGKILQALDEEGFRQNTLVMFISDNGISTPFAKANCNYYSNSTPWIVRWPDTIAPGSVDSVNYICGIDYMPTILETAGLPMVPKMNGASFLPLLRNPSAQGRKWVFTEINSLSSGKFYTMRSIETNGFRYIYNPWSNGTFEYSAEAQSGLTWNAMVSASSTDTNIAARVKLYRYRVLEELYDVIKDPDNLYNLVNSTASAEKLKTMRQQLANKMLLYGDTVLKKFELKYGVKGVIDTPTTAVKITPESGPAERFTLLATPGGFRLKGTGGITGEEVRIWNLQGKEIPLDQVGAGNFRFVRKQAGAVYCIRIGGNYWKVLF